MNLNNSPMSEDITPKVNENLNPLVVLQPGETIICEIKRHPAGIIIQYIGGIFCIIIALILVMLLSTRLSNENGSSSLFEGMYFGFGVLVLGVVVLLGAFTKVYWGNKWVVTSDSLTQITQNSLFGTRVSQMSLENLEDVTVTRKGFLPYMFGYGTLHAETAGEKSKFVFEYCPSPDQYARNIIDAREKFAQGLDSQR
jgi:hypothetical protein